MTWLIKRWRTPTCLKSTHLKHKKTTQLLNSSPQTIITSIPQAINWEINWIQGTLRIKCLLVCHFLKTVTNWEHLRETKAWLPNQWSYQLNPLPGTSIRASLTSMTLWRNQFMRQIRWKQTNPRVCYWTSSSTRVLAVSNPTNPSNQLLTTITSTIQSTRKINLKNQSTIITLSVTLTNHHQTPPVSLPPILQLQVNKLHHLQSPLLKIKTLQIYTRINPNQ